MRGKESTNTVVVSELSHEGSNAARFPEGFSEEVIRLSAELRHPS